MDTKYPCYDANSKMTIATPRTPRKLLETFFTRPNQQPAPYHLENTSNRTRAVIQMTPYAYPEAIKRNYIDELDYIPQWICSLAILRH
jgi:hypothetical protein